MARPSKLTPEKEKAICDALRAGNTRTAAAGYVGIDRHTLANWTRQYPPFLAAIEKAEQEAEVRFVAQVAKAATDGTWTAAAWWLERRRNQDWGKVDRVEVTIKQVAEKLASEMGIDAADLIAEAERIVAG